MRSQQLDVDACKAGLEEIDAQLKLGTLSNAEANVARLALLTPPRASRWSFLPHQQSSPQTLVVVAAVFFLVSGIGAATSYLEYPRRELASADANASDAELLARLQNYAGSIPADDPSPPKTAGTMLPDVNTMVDRLAARLETNPKDLEGWRTLGWSYFHMARYDQAATAFGHAVDLDPASTELKRSYDDAKAKAAAGGDVETASTSQPAVSPPVSPPDPGRGERQQRRKRGGSHRFRTCSCGRPRRRHSIDGGRTGQPARAIAA